MVRSHSPISRAPARVFGRPAGEATRGAGIRPGLFYGSFAALFATNVVTLVGFLMAPDIAALMNGQNDLVFSAYEDRIAELRVEIDRLHSRQFAQAGDLKSGDKLVLNPPEKLKDGDAVKVAAAGAK